MTSTQTTTPELRLLLSACESAKALSICEKTLWSMTAPRGDLPAVRVGRRVLYHVADLAAWIERRKEKGVDPK